MNNTLFSQQPQQKQSGGYRIPSPSKTAKRSSVRKPNPSSGATTGGGHQEVHRIMSLFQ
jgi:hypothetical protein